MAPEHSYDKIFLPGIEKTCTVSGTDDRLVLRGRQIDAVLGFTTCYDYLFTHLLRRYAFDDRVDAIVQIASWRGASSREYPRMNVRTDLYYGHLWDATLAAASAQNQTWTIACNTVGRHETHRRELLGWLGHLGAVGDPAVAGLPPCRGAG